MASLTSRSMCRAFRETTTAAAVARRVTSRVQTQTSAFSLLAPATRTVVKSALKEKRRANEVFFMLQYIYV